MAELDDLTTQVEVDVDQAARDLERIETDFSARVRRWWVEAYTSKFWTDFRKHAEEDMGFYTGDAGGQWSMDNNKDAYEQLKAQGRATGQSNHIGPVVDVITGYERQNRYDLKTVPTGNEDVEDAQAMTLLLKHEQEQTECAATCSEVFEQTVIVGASAVDLGIDWSRDPVHGRITIEKLEPSKDCMWDPNFRAKDASDSKYMFRYHTAWVEDVIAMFPDQEKKIRDAVGSLDAAVKDNKLSEWSPVDGYGSVRSHPKESPEVQSMFYDAAGDGRLMVIQVWYAEYEDYWIVADKRTGTVTEYEDDAKGAREAAAADPDHLTAIKRKKRLIRGGTILPAIFAQLEEGETPFENDQEDYPIIPCIGKRQGDWMAGIVRGLKDPQRNENKREAQLTDLVAKMANLRIMYEQNSVENVADLQDWWSQKPIAFRNGHQPPAFLVPPLGELVHVLQVTGDRNKMTIREASGINTELLGLETDQSSGIAIARRQAQGQVISTVWFDNYRYFRKMLGKRLAKRIQQVYTAEQTIRVIGSDGIAKLITVNPMGAMDLEQDAFRKYKEEKRSGLLGPDDRPTFLRNRDELQYDVVISEVPTTPTARATSLLAILEILKVMPGLAPILGEVVLELAEIPERSRILNEFRAMKANASMGGAPPGGGAVKPPGSPVPPAGAQAPPTGASGLPTPESTTSAI